jgi:hypothetical protein
VLVVWRPPAGVDRKMPHVKSAGTIGGPDEQPHTDALGPFNAHIRRYAVDHALNCHGTSPMPPAANRMP